MKTPEQILREYAEGAITIDLGEGQQPYSTARFEALCGLLRSDMAYGDMSHQRELGSLLKYVAEHDYDAIRTTIKNFIYSTKWRNTKARAEKWVQDFFDHRHLMKYDHTEEIVRGLWLRAREIRKTPGKPVTKLIRHLTEEYVVAYIGHKAPLNTAPGSQHILAEFDQETKMGKSVCGRYQWFGFAVEKPPYCFRCWELADPTPPNPLEDVPLDIEKRLPHEEP